MKDKKAPRNTTKELQDNPILGYFMVVEGERSILAQESQGQRSLVESDTLPTVIGRYDGYYEKAILEAAGMKFLGPVEGDDMFQYVELPHGWKKVATSHSMWSNLVDNKGRVRATIFYKAAFYDRRARMNLSRRFEVSQDYDRQDKENIAVAHVTDGGKVVYTTESIKLPTGSQKYEVADQVENAAIAWLDKNYADWRNPGAYWD